MTNFEPSKYALGIVVVLFFSVILLIGCENQQEKENRLAREKAEEIETREEIAEIMFRKDAVLLALKYQVDEEKLFNLLVGWRCRLLGNTLLNDTIGIYDEFTGKIAKERLEQYSKKYNIPLDVIAAILIDYEAMHCNDL